jgi:hypothetical protein
MSEESKVDLKEFEGMGIRSDSFEDLGKGFE